MVTETWQNKINEKKIIIHFRTDAKIYPKKRKELHKMK